MTGRRKEVDDRRQGEARDALRRLSDESETLGTSSLARAADKARSHMSARDADQDDRIEVWGTRIGRIGAVMFAIFLLYWLADFFSSR